MIDLAATEIDLLEEFREGIAPWAISNAPFKTELSPEMTQLLYKLVCEKVAENDLPYKIVKSLREVS